MARYKNITRTATIRYALKYWWNVVRNYDEEVYDQDFFDIVAYNLKRDEVAAIIGGNFGEKELKPLKEAKSDKLELDRDCVGFMLKRIWNEKPLRKGCRAVRRRFDYSVHFRSLTLAQREKIWKNNIRKMDMCGLVPESAAAALAERYETSAGGITMVLENVRRLKPDSAHAAELIERIMRPHCELMHSPIQDGKGRPAQDYSLEGLNIKWDIGLHQMENFDGVMIGATNFFENLDPAVLRRFTFKLEFGYLDDAGKRIFFERTFRTRLTDEEAARLDAVARLAPGDFRTVRQSLYYLGDAVNNAMRLGELEKESGIKSGPSRTKIGF